MKTLLVSTLTATLLGFASLSGGHLFDAADFLAIMFATTLVAWTVAHYSRPVRALTTARPIRLRVRITADRPQLTTGRLAA